MMASKNEVPRIKTPRTMSNSEFLTELAQQLRDMTESLAVVGDQLERVLGPSPRPELRLVTQGMAEGFRDAAEVLDDA
jgi:hypothetical protein